MSFPSTYPSLLSNSSWFDSLLSSNPQAQNAAFSMFGFNPQGGDENVTALQKLGMFLYPQAAALSQYGASLIPSYEQGISGLLNSLSPSGLNSQMNQDIAASNEGSAASGQEAALQARGAGLGDGIQGGLINANQAQGAAQANSIRSYYTSPQAKAQAFGDMMNAFQQGFSNPAMNQMLSMTGPLAQQQQINYATQSPSFLGQMAGLAGQASGLYQGGLFGNQGSFGNTGQFGTGSVSPLLGGFDSGIGGSGGLFTNLRSSNGGMYSPAWSAPGSFGGFGFSAPSSVLGGF